MSAHRECDSCGRKITEQNPIVMKLFMIPVLPGQPAKHSSYTHHMDVGKCCYQKTVDWKWQKRKTRKESNQSRQLRKAS